MSFTPVIDQFSDEDFELDDDWKKLAEELLGETKSDIENKIKEFRTAAIESTELQEVAPVGGAERSDQYYTRFLRATNWVVPDALAMLINYYKLCRKYPKYMIDRTPGQLESYWASKMNGASITRDQHGRRVYFMRMHTWDTQKIPLEDMMLARTIMTDMLSQEVKTQIAGITYIYDLKGFEMRHVKQFGREDLRFLGEFKSGAFPIWIRAIHFINTPKVVDIIYNLGKPFIGKRVKDFINFHGSNLSSLHAMIPKACLPEDLGGEAGEFDNRACVKACLDKEEYYKKMRDGFA